MRIEDAQAPVDELVGSTAHDVLTVSLNGTSLPSETATWKEHGGYLYGWLEFPLNRGT